MRILSSLLAPKRRVHRARDCRFQPRMEALEDRCCPSGTSSFEWADPTGGALDPTFGSGGQVLTSFSNNEDVANAVTIQPDGKAVIAGYTQAAVSSTFSDFLVARYNADGSLDSSFGTGGRTITDFQSDTDQAHAVALQPQASGPSKILVAGLAWVKRYGAALALARYNANGTLDTTFGNKGKVTSSSPATAVVVDAAGRILVGTGSTVLRYTANGTLDTTFGNRGSVTTVGYARSPQYIAIQADGKIVVGGDMNDPATGTPEFVLTRFTANGALDPTFGSGGVVKTHPGDYDNFIGVAIQSDGKIVLFGHEGHLDSDGVERHGAFLLRFTTSGALDPGFGLGGVVYQVDPSWLMAGYSGGMGIQADGQIVAGGDFVNADGSLESFGCLRVSPTGTLDPGFADNGWANIKIGTAGNERAFALQPDGRVLLVGLVRPTPNNDPMDVALVRFLTSAPQIGSFTANPNPVTLGSSTALTVSSITDANPGATVAQVAFYSMINGSGVLLGYGTQNGDGSWSLAFDTTGYAPGTYTLYAQATDNYGALGNPVALTLSVL